MSGETPEEVSAEGHGSAVESQRPALPADSLALKRRADRVVFPCLADPASMCRG